MRSKTYIQRKLVSGGKFLWRQERAMKNNVKFPFPRKQKQTKSSLFEYSVFSVKICSFPTMFSASYLTRKNTTTHVKESANNTLIDYHKRIRKKLEMCTTE